MYNQSTNIYSLLANQQLRSDLDQEVITDPDLQRIFHGLQKKSGTTKTKMLQELKTMLPSKDQEFYEQFTPTFISIYRYFFDNEYERRVLVACNEILGLVQQHGKKSQQKKFKQLFPRWFFLMNDYTQEISESASKAFNIAFPKEKHGSAIQICTDTYLKELKYYLAVSYDTVKQECNLDDEQTSCIYERCKVAAIKSIVTALQWNPQPGFTEQLMEILDFQGKVTPIIEALNNKMFRIVSQALETLDFLLSHPVAGKFVMIKGDQLLKKSLDLFEDKDRMVQNALWRGFLINIFSRATPDQLKSLKNIETKLIDLLTKAGFGVGKVLYDNVLSYLKLTPIFHNITKEEVLVQKISSFRKLLDSILQGLMSVEARFFDESLTDAYFKVLLYVLCEKLIPHIQTYPNALNQLKNVSVQAIKAIVQLSLDNLVPQAYNYLPQKQVPENLRAFWSSLIKQDEIIQKITNSFFEEFKHMKFDNRFIKQLLEVNPQSIAQPQIQDYLKHVFESIYLQNDIEKGECLDVLPPIQALKRDDADQKIKETIISFLNRPVQKDQHIQQCIQTKRYIYNIERIQQIKIIDQILIQVIDQEISQEPLEGDHQAALPKVVFLFIFCDNNTDPSLYLQSQVDYQRLKKFINPQPQASTDSINHLIQQLLKWNQFSIKHFIPAILNNCTAHVPALEQLYATTSEANLQLFEELSFIFQQIAPKERIIEIIHKLFQQQTSSKASTLVEFLTPKNKNNFLSFFVRELNIEHNLDRFILFLETVIPKLKLDHQEIFKLLNFSLKDPQAWRILKVLELPEDFYLQLYKEGNLQLMAQFLAAPYSSIMLYDHKLKRFVQNIVLNKVKSVILDNLDQSIQVIKILFESTDIAYGVALKNLVQSIQAEEKDLGLEPNPQLAQLIVSQISDDVSKMVTLRQIIYVVDLQKEISVNQTVEAFLKTQKLYQLDILTLAIKQSNTLLVLQDDSALLDEVIKHLFDLSLANNYEKMVAFDFINVVCERKTIIPFASYIKEIYKLFKSLFQANVQLQRYYSFSIAAALQFVRKILNFIEAFPVEFIDFLNFELTDSLLNIIEFCKDLPAQFMDEQNNALFVEYAETLMRCLQLEKWPSFDTTIYVQLLQCPFISITQAAFLALNERKQKVPIEGIEGLLGSIDLKREERQLEEDQEVITFPLKNQILNYLLAWLISDKKKDREQFQLYLSNLIYILEFLRGNGVAARFSHKEIYQGDLDLLAIQDDQSELLKLIVISFYQFIIMQQSFFKQWYAQECSLGQRKLLDELVVLISKAIYQREVEIIEQSLLDWREEGFDIYAQQNQQEIVAIYQKEESKIQIIITLPQGYPLKPPKVETLKGVKLGEDKMKKWSLMIRQILQSNNDTILSAVKLWKKNIDSQFADLDVCAICQYIVHQNGELPKMPCKTCKNKFHSSCIQKWLQSSGKSTCPLCKSQFL